MQFLNRLFGGFYPIATPDSLANLFTLIIVFTTFLPITTGLVLRLENADILVLTYLSLS